MFFFRLKLFGEDCHVDCGEERDRWSLVVGFFKDLPQVFQWVVLCNTQSVPVVVRHGIVLANQRADTRA